jgi:putative DNA methylase
MGLKLIEVALPLKAINEAASAEKKTTARLAHPANVHLWWARRPLVASRAILFAQLVDDPIAHPEIFATPELILEERSRLFKIMEGLLDIKGPTPEHLSAARDEIVRSVGEGITLVDPFAGGGSIPIEGQRLGLHVEASDLNPVPVLLNIIMLDKVRSALDKPAVHPESGLLSLSRTGNGLNGLAEDLVYYGNSLHRMVADELGEHYPLVKDKDGREHPVIAWIWAKTVPCPNPACRRPAPLMSTFWLSKKSGRETWLVPHVGEPGSPIRFSLESGKGSPKSQGSKIGRGAKFICLGCNEPIDSDHVKSSGREGRMQNQLVAIAALGDRRRIYFEANEFHVRAAKVTPPEVASEELAADARAIWVRNYGFTTHASLFTARQLAALSAFASKLEVIKSQIMRDSSGDEDYADLVTTVLGLCISKLADTNNGQVTWLLKDEVPAHMFTRHAIPMVWDFPEANILGTSSGSWTMTVASIARSISGQLTSYARPSNINVRQANAATRDYPKDVVVSTDPPYFDNIGYADLADFFYVWLRLGLRFLFPDLFATLLTPKLEELVAIPYRFDGNQSAANEHFENGFRDVFSQIKKQHHPEIPMTVFYAYKQEDDEREGEEGSSGAGATGWEKLLQGMVDTGLQVTATWPIRTEMGNRMIGLGTNSLASSVVLSCRPRPTDAGITDRQGFMRHLRQILGEKIVELHSGGVLPVDMAQASIGPGMSVFTSYSRVLDGANQSMSVGTALQLINHVLDELQSDNDSDLDADTRWAVSWFEQNGMNAGPFGDAQNLATARSTAMNAIERSGIIASRSGNVRLLDRSEYPDDWDPESDKRITVWEVCQHLIRRLDGDGGLVSAASLLRQAGGLGDAARDLSYRLYEIANRNGWADEARAYNNLAAEWPDLVALAAQAPRDPTTLF